MPILARPAGSGDFLSTFPAARNLNYYVDLGEWFRTISANKSAKMSVPFEKYTLATHSRFERKKRGGRDGKNDATIALSPHHESRASFSKYGCSSPPRDEPLPPSCRSCEFQRTVPWGHRTRSACRRAAPEKETFHRHSPINIVQQ